MRDYPTGPVVPFLARVFLFLVACGATAFLIHFLFGYPLFNAMVAVVLVDYAMDRTTRYRHDRLQPIEPAISSYVDRQVRRSR